jgi:hypothetical protein
MTAGFEVGFTRTVLEVNHHIAMTQPSVSVNQTFRLFESVAALLRGLVWITKLQAGSREGGMGAGDWLTTDVFIP